MQSAPPTTPTGVGDTVAVSVCGSPIFAPVMDVVLSEIPVTGVLANVTKTLSLVEFPI